MSSFQERFNELLQRTGIDASTLAANLDVSKQTISAWKTGVRSPKRPVLKVIAKYFDVSLPWLCGLDVPIGSYQDPAGQLPDGLIPISDLHMHKIPLLGSVAAGEPIYDPEFPGIIVESPTDADFALKIRGDSMEPDFLDGDLVFVKLLPDIPHDGCVCVMAIDDEATLKRVYRQQDGVMLLSNNPMYSPMYYKFSEHAVRVLGVPVGFTRMLIK